MATKKIYKNVEVSDQTINGINSLLEHTPIRLKIINIEGKRFLKAVSFIKCPKI